MSAVSVWDLMKYHGLREKECDCQIKDTHIDDISLALGKDWRLLPSHLGMPRITSDDIDRDFKTEKEKRHALLCQWKEMDGSAATYKRLIEALLKIHNRAGAENVCELLKKLSILQQGTRQEASNPADSAPGKFYLFALSFTKLLGRSYLGSESVTKKLSSDLLLSYFKGAANLAWVRLVISHAESRRVIANYTAG